MKKNKHLGSTFESFLEEDGILEEVNAAAVKAVKELLYDDWLNQELQDPQMALAYLTEAFKDEDIKMRLIALKKVLKAFSSQDTDSST